jgi:hypothetical protein
MMDLFFFFSLFFFFFFSLWILWSYFWMMRLLVVVLTSTVKSKSNRNNVVKWRVQISNKTCLISSYCIQFLTDNNNKNNVSDVISFSHLCDDSLQTRFPIKLCFLLFKIHLVTLHMNEGKKTRYKQTVIRYLFCIFIAICQCTHSKKN